MNRSDAPAKQSKPFGINGPREAILATTPSGDNSASYESGFPPITMTLKSAGGLPPKGQDMNQILFELSALARWSSSGALNSYDSTFSTGIGGYPKDALIVSNDGNTIYVNTTDGNITNPNSGGAGWVDLATFLKLSSGSPAIGVPFYWPSAAMPNTVLPEWSDMAFLKFNGATFSAATYPKLALVFPALLLPEARGEFPRIWDDGRGVDSGRALLSAQGFAMQNITGSMGSRNVVGTSSGVIGVASGAFNLSIGTAPSLVAVPRDASSPNADNITFDASRVVNTASETRPRNIAFNFLVRAK